MNVILGNGQISHALRPYLDNYEVFDKGEWETIRYNKNCNILHICIPYSKAFKSIVNDAHAIFQADVVLVHSTVEPGTCESINAAYSPIMGRHANDFEKDITKYRKFVACHKDEWKMIKDNINLNMAYWGDNTAELEYSKIMSTTYMYWNLLFQKLMMKDCQEEQFDFTKTYKLWNENYNRGVKDEWTRPIYDYDSNPIPGGHCLGNNLDLYDNFITSLLKEWEKNKGELTITSHRKY